MDISVGALAELRPDGPWASFALALASRGASFTATADPTLPTSLGVLEGVKVGLQVDEGDVLWEGCWEIDVGPLDVITAEDLGATVCRLLGGDDTYWRLVVCWDDTPEAARVSQVWVRDELAKTALGGLDSFLATVVLAALDPDNSDITFDDSDLAARVAGVLREAAALRAVDPGLPVTAWQRAVSDAPDEPAPTLDQDSFADLEPRDQERALWALDRRARHHVRTGTKPAKGLFAPKAIAAILRAGITSGDPGVAAAAWWVLATLEVAGPKKSSWLKRVASDPEAAGLDADLIAWAQAGPGSATPLGKIRRPTPSSQLAAVIVSRSKKRLDTKDSERVSKHVPTPWSLSRSITHGSALGTHANQALEKNAPHPPSLAERLVELLEERPCDPAELGLTRLGSADSVPAPLVARLRALAATRVELACLLARLTSAREYEAELLRAIDQLEGRQRQWGLALKLLFERDDWTADDRADLLAHAAMSASPTELSITHYLQQLDPTALTARGRSSVELLATHESQKISETAAVLLKL